MSLEGVTIEMPRADDSQSIFELGDRIPAMDKRPSRARPSDSIASILSRAGAEFEDREEREYAAEDRRPSRSFLAEFRPSGFAPQERLAAAGGVAAAAAGGGGPRGRGRDHGGRSYDCCTSRHWFEWVLRVNALFQVAMGTSGFLLGSSAQIPGNAAWAATGVGGVGFVASVGGIYFIRKFVLADSLDETADELKQLKEENAELIQEQQRLNEEQRRQLVLDRELNRKLAITAAQLEKETTAAMELRRKLSQIEKVFSGENNEFGEHNADLQRYNEDYRKLNEKLSEYLASLEKVERGLRKNLNLNYLKSTINNFVRKYDAALAEQLKVKPKKRGKLCEEFGKGLKELQDLIGKFERTLNRSSIQESR
ncbi:hypothetical protein SCG7109_AV_00100 [Chlamydiales bacterium SCGC AG-110-M15]|nr:hypothetical protein SCG7109_AV_00100 [Chlamydiales bacterium SCGC AG-110-M15]